MGPNDQVKDHLSGMHLDNDTFLGLDKEVIESFHLNDNLIIALVIPFVIGLAFRLAYKLQIQRVVRIINALSDKIELLTGFHVEESDAAVILVDLFVFDVAEAWVLFVAGHEDLA
jgi:hypothetical protein